MLRAWSVDLGIGCCFDNHCSPRRGPQPTCGMTFLAGATKACVACELAGCDLAGRDFKRAKLDRANLRGVNLSKCTLFRASLVRLICRPPISREAI